MRSLVLATYPQRIEPRRPPAGEKPASRTVVIPDAASGLVASVTDTMRWLEDEERMTVQRVRNNAPGRQLA